MSEEARRTLRYVEPLSDARTPLEDFFSILLVGKAQGEEAAKASFFRSEKTGKPKSYPFGTTGTHDAVVIHDGIIIFGGMKL